MLTERVSRRQFLHRVGAATVATTVAGHVATSSQRVQAADVPTGSLRFGVQIVPQHATYADILQTWREADDLGFDTAFLFDVRP